MSTGHTASVSSLDTLPVDLDKTLSTRWKDITLLKRLWPFIKPHWKGLAYSLGLMIPISLSSLAQPFVVRAAIDGPITNGNFGGLLQYCALFLGLLVVMYTLRYHQLVVSQLTGQRIIYEIRTHLYAHLQNLSPRFYQQHPIGKIVTRLTNDVENLSEMFASGGIAIVSDVALIMGAVVGMFLMNVQMALITLVVLPVVAMVIEFFRRKSRKTYDESRVRVAKLNAFLNENFSGIEVVKLMRREEINYQDFERLNHTNLKVGLHSVFYDSSLTASIEFLLNLTILWILWTGGQLLLAGAMTFGLLVAFFQYAQMMFEPIEDVSDKYTIIQSGLASVDKLMDLFDAVPEIPPTLEIAAQYPVAKGDIVFDQVTFAYLKDAEEPILKNVSFHVTPGQTVAIVGASGAGKSTLMKLLCRFYDVQDGQVLLDGKNIMQWELADLRRNIVVIQQDDFLFSRSVLENITLDTGEADTSKLEIALDQSNARTVIDRLPDGLETVLEERGKNLSGGEKQLILFARAIYHQPAVLVLDEATSAVDPQTERLIQAAMANLSQQCTTLVVAHRLSTIEAADQILVIEGGQLVEQGTHAELLAKQGIYSGYYERYQTQEEG
ncbi:MAG: ABC transporter ATP-binding protein/permease [Vampirovibrio sp.]|nr:ABC transporter ATP-binding protein/permease [Vampirovibrio sp.]